MGRQCTSWWRAARRPGTHSLRETHLLFECCFPYVCAEPVLVKRSFPLKGISKRLKKCVFRTAIEELGVAIGAADSIAADVGSAAFRSLPEKLFFLNNVSYACPEPVLVKRSCLCRNGSTGSFCRPRSRRNRLARWCWGRGGAACSSNRSCPALERSVAFFLMNCLSRACLGKIDRFRFIYRKRKAKAAFPSYGVHVVAGAVRPGIAVGL